MGAVCPGASVSRGPYQLESKFLFMASLDVIKEPLIGAAYNVQRVPPDSVPPDSHAFCPLCSLAWIASRRPRTGAGIFAVYSSYQ